MPIRNLAAFTVVARKGQFLTVRHEYGEYSKAAAACKALDVTIKIDDIAAKMYYE
jgi:hypothetical protein